MTENRTYIPLAERMRPKTLSDVVGQELVIGPGKLLHDDMQADQLKSLILWGPPGVGKTTIARIVATQADAQFVEISAVTAGKADMKAAVASAHDFNRLGQRTIVFIDEIHRFNKAQQDFLLPFVEDGTIILIGATTENPSFEVISPLLSRSALVVLEPLKKTDIEEILQRAKKYIKGKTLQKKSIEAIADLSGGDARRALNILELAQQLSQKTIGLQNVEEAAKQVGLKYDKTGDEHYNTISAFIKSMRGSDVDAALFYLHRMIESGESPTFIARRMVIFAAEDIGMASPHALTLAVSVFQAVEKVGMPESRYILSEGAIALASSKKSRAVADAMSRAAKSVTQNPGAQVPLHLRNAPTDLMGELGYGKDYQWSADFKHPKGFMPEGLENETFYKTD